MKKIDIVWNITRICPWNCEICCVDAIHTTRHDRTVRLCSQDRTDEFFPQQSDHGLYNQALSYLQQNSLELSLKDKLKILDHLDGYLPKIDFSGGDPLTINDTLEVMKVAVNRFGKENVTVTTTSVGMRSKYLEMYTSLIGELNFSYDGISSFHNPHRPEGYTEGNLKYAAMFESSGIPTRAECPLSIKNIDENILQQLYMDLNKANVSKLLLMRLFPVGRGAFHVKDIPNLAQYMNAIRYLKEMEAKFKKPRLELQCALKFINDQKMVRNPCDLIQESFGLTANGTLLLSPWAIGSHGDPLNDAWVAGNLVTTPLKELLNSDKIMQYRHHLNDNFGHCKIMAYHFSQDEDQTKRIFSKCDPLVVLNNI